MSDSCRPIFPATAYTGDDPIANEFAKLYRPHSTDYETGMKAVDLILLNRTPSYTDPMKGMDFLEYCSLGGRALEDWGPTDESIIEELGIASFMFPEILHDDDYEWYITLEPGMGLGPSWSSLNDVRLRKLHHMFHFPSKLETDTFFAISEEDIRRGQWIMPGRLHPADPGPGSRADLEWDECLDLSYFAEYDQSTDQEFFIVDNKGCPALHNAERHEQRCALNALWNHPELDQRVKSTITSLDGSGFTRLQEVVEKRKDLEQCGIHGVECSLIASGDNFSAGICRYGGIFVPKRFQALIGDEGNFTARLTISAVRTKYPLRVVEINRC